MTVSDIQFRQSGARGNKSLSTDRSGVKGIPQRPVWPLVCLYFSACVPSATILLSSFCSECGRTATRMDRGVKVPDEGGKKDEWVDKSDLHAFMFRPKTLHKYDLISPPQFQDRRVPSSRWFTLAMILSMRFSGALRASQIL